MAPTQSVVAPDIAVRAGRPSIGAARSIVSGITIAGGLILRAL
jgi:hypothetical protein